MTCYDLCVAWNWKYDADFIACLDAACTSNGLRFLQITPDSLAPLLAGLHDGSIDFKMIFDRASDDDTRFFTVVEWSIHRGKLWINAHEHAFRSWNKADLHPKLIHAGLHTPYTIILPPHTLKPDISSLNLQILGERFIVKPAHGGGGMGVRHAGNMKDVCAIRREHPGDTYLLQRIIEPRSLDGHPAWFRVIHCTGRFIPCWWHPKTHVYTRLTKTEMDAYQLHSLNEMSEIISRVSGLDIFSTEIALAVDGRFVAIDYVNDPIDLRLQSKTHDGVPDDIVRDVADLIAATVKKKLGTTR